MVETRLASLVRTREREILDDWTALQLKSLASRRDLINDAELQRQSRDFLGAFTRALDTGVVDIGNPAWASVKEMLQRVSASRAQQGFTPSETATFIFSMKQPIFMS